MKVSQIMSQRPVVVGLDDPLSLIKEIFDHARFHHLLVVEEGKLCGVISDRDLLKAVSMNISASTHTYRVLTNLNKRAHQIVTRNPITLHPDATIDDAVEIFNKYRISCIPIIDNEGAPIGILSWRDILKNFGAICREKD